MDSTTPIPDDTPIIDQKPITGTIVVSPTVLRETCLNEKCIKVFLGGAIVNGTAESLIDLPVYVLNPLRADWDPNSDIDTRKAQINWEFEAQAISNIILYNFDKDFTSPTTLLEFGTFCRSQDIIVVVCCSPDYPYYLNVDHICENVEIPIFFNIDEAITKVREEVEIRSKMLLNKIEERKEFMNNNISKDGIDNDALTMLMQMFGINGNSDENGMMNIIDSYLNHSHDSDCGDDCGDDDCGEDNKCSFVELLSDDGEDEDDEDEDKDEDEEDELQ